MLINSLELELDASRTEQSKLLTINKKLSEVKYTNSEIAQILSKNNALESHLKGKEEQIFDMQNQIIYLKENSNTIMAELKVTKNSLNQLRKTYIKLRDGVEPKNSFVAKLDDFRVRNSELSEKILKIQSDKSEIEENLIKSQSSHEEIMSNTKGANKKLLEELNSLKGLLKEKDAKGKDLHKEIMDLKIELVSTENQVKSMAERVKYLEKDLNTEKEKAFAYKKRFEETSVENNLLKETIGYKEDQIKRDKELIKSYREIEQEHLFLKSKNKNLEEMCKEYSGKLERLSQTVNKERDKWYKQEKIYQETIENLKKDQDLLKMINISIFPSHEVGN